MLIHADNFDIYGTDPTEMLNAGRYSSVGAVLFASDPDGASTPRCLQSGPGNGGIRRALKTPTTKVGMCARFWANNLPANNSQRPWLFYWSDASNTPMARVLLNTTGAMQFDIFDTTSGAFGDWFTITTTSGPVVTSGAWWHVAAQFDPNGGTFKLQVEGVQKINSLSTSWGGHLHNGPTIYQGGFVSNVDGTSAGCRIFIKDYVWWDGLGSRNNDFLGTVLVIGLVPDGDVDIGGWVPSTGSEAWSLLDGDPGLTPYVSADNTPPAPMEMTLTDLPPDITTVRGIITVVRAAKVDGGDGNLQVSMISAGDASSGEDRPITAAQTDWEDTHELNPDTSAPWTPSEVNAASIRVDRTI